MIIEAQAPEAREAIKKDIMSAAEAMRVDGTITCAGLIYSRRRDLLNGIAR